MLTAFAAVLLHSASKTVTLPIGIAPRVSDLVARIGEATSQKNFSQAKSLARLLPSSKVKIAWDASAVPANALYDFQTKRDAVLRAWSSGGAIATFEYSKDAPDIKIVFNKTGESKYDWSESPTSPTLTINIGLNQGQGVVDPAAVYTTIGYGIGSYLGIARLPMPGFLMAGASSPSQGDLAPNLFEKTLAVTALRACGEVRASVEKSAVIDAQLPSSGYLAKPLELGAVVQGARVPIQFKVPNEGKGNLRLQIVPDCDCFTTNKTPVEVLPGATASSDVSMDTTQFSGTVHKTLYVFTNDPKAPVLAVPLTITIKPRYRFLPPPGVFVAEAGNFEVVAYLYVPEGHPMEITSAVSEGLPGEVKVEPWEGTMADPDMNEGPLPRKGYKLTMNLENVPDVGRLGTNIALYTDDAVFQKITYPIFVQRGIIAQPTQVNLGVVGSAARQATFNVNRPGKPFKVLGVETDSAHIKATVTASERGDTYVVTVSFDGKADKGDFRGTVTIKTDDPKQPEIDVPVTGDIR